MKYIDEISNQVIEFENVYIPMNDGCRLAARIWLPKNTDSYPVPAILEYLPYRKRDGTAWRDQLTHPYFAAHGYAAVRVDMRGSGESDGLLLDEYLPQEQDDCLQILRWLAEQPWCNGKVGMIGISWGGFNGLQVAALQPPELQAVISLCSTDDRYADDIHYMGGCLLNDNLQWAMMMLALMSRAPDKALVGDRWREMWLNRLENQPLFIDTWLKHQHRDAYWKHGSICENWNAITCPVYLVGGWLDGYASTISRMLQHLTCPRKGLIGPWAHKYPHFATPEPRIGFLQESLRWFDYWLKGVETGVMDEPMFRVWMEDSFYPNTNHAIKSGRWIAESGWPSETIHTQLRYLNPDNKLEISSGSREQIEIITPQSVGESSGAWCGYGFSHERPGDQRVDDDRSLCFDTEPLQERLEIFGSPQVTLEIEVDKPLAFLAIRLNEVMPDGQSARISYGLLNLTHRDGDEKSISASGRMTVTVTLNDIAHVFDVNNRIRVAISTSYWPIVFPSPESVKLSVITGKSYLSLPVRKPKESDAGLREFDPPEAAPALSQTYLRPAVGQRYVERDMNTGLANYHIVEDNGHYIIDSIGLESEFKKHEIYQIHDADPLSANINIRYTVKVGRKDWQTRAEIECRMHASKTHFLIDAKLNAYENDQCLLTKEWHESIERDGV